MGKAENKHPLTLILAVAVFLIAIAGVLILLTGPAKALTDAKCEDWALEIKGRAEKIRDDTTGFDALPFANDKGCKNLCEGGALRNLGGTKFLRNPAGVIAATIADIENTPGDKFYTHGVYGSVAFFCVGDPITTPNTWTDVVVGTTHPDASACGSDYKSICEALLSQPIPVE